jgi:Concanavalin A-like lectin/glucanases superfamily
MRRIVLAALACLLCHGAFADMLGPSPVILNRAVSPPAAPSYTGPGNIVGGAVLAVSVRGYNAAYNTGSNNAATLLRASDSTTSNIKILANGNIDAATAGTFCASTTCTDQTWIDQSGTGNNCTQNTTSWPTLVSSSSPFAGYSTSFQYDQGMNCGSSSSLKIGTFTYIAWTYLTNISAGSWLMGGQDAVGPEFAIDSTGKLYLNSSLTVAIGNSGTNLVAANTWTCVAVSYNSGTGAYAFYINGTAAGSGTNATTFSFTSFSIGFANYTGGLGVGYFAEVLVYPSVLTGTQVNNICNATSP